MKAGSAAEWLVHAESDLTYEKLDRPSRRSCENQVA